MELFFLYKLQTCKPDSVLSFDNGHHLSVPPVTRWNQSAYPSPVSLRKVYRVNIHAVVSYSIQGLMWHFSTQGLPFFIIADKKQELLPPIFTLTLLARERTSLGGYFLWHFLFPLSRTRLFTGAMLYAVRTFLPALLRSDDPVCSVILILKINFSCPITKRRMILIHKRFHLFF
jgi:hypothetical protein